MKFSAWQQSYANKRSSSFRAISGPLDTSSDGSIKSASAIFWLVLHGLCCLISLVLGFRFSRLVFFLLFSSPAANLYTSPFRSASELAQTLTFYSTPTATNLELPAANRTAGITASPSSRVVVGRHGIRIRPWPHPNPVEVMKAHRIIERVQREQRVQFGFKNPRTVIVVTPTYVRTFQALHLTGVMHSLMNVPYDLVWIVVEAGGATNETASIIAKSGLRTIHVGFRQRMPNLWAERHRLEARMRLHALRIVREKKLDGIVMFADDSNMHSMELFDEIQNVKWVGAISVGILAHSSETDEESSASVIQKEDEENRAVPVQGPACNSSNQLVGWHTFNSIPYVGKSATYIGDREIVLPRKLEWAGFVLNSQLLWKDAEDRPEWASLSPKPTRCCYSACRNCTRSEDLLAELAFEVMVGWQRHVQFVLRRVGKRVEHSYNVSANFSSYRLESSISPCELPYLQRLWRPPPANISRPFYQYFQQMGISSSRNLLAESSEEAAIPSPLTPVLALNSGKSEDQNQKAVSKPSTVQAVLKGIKQSPKKVNLVAALVRGMRVEDALLQLQVTVKRAAKTVYQVIHSARANATHNHGLDPDRLLVAEAFLGKGLYKKRVSYHSKGRCGVKMRPECRLTVVVREMTDKEEAEIARLRVHNFRKLTKRERRLVPHKLIETTPVWNRKGYGLQS